MASVGHEVQAPSHPDDTNFTEYEFIKIEGTTAIVEDVETFDMPSSFQHPVTKQNLSTTATESLRLGIKALQLLDHYPGVLTSTPFRDTKCQMDFLSMEANWMSRDVYYERKWKMSTAFKLSKEVRNRRIRKERENVKMISNKLSAAIGSYWLGVSHKVCPLAIDKTLDPYVMALNAETREAPQGQKKLVLTNEIGPNLFDYSVNFIEWICIENNIPYESHTNGSQQVAKKRKLNEQVLATTNARQGIVVNEALHLEESDGILVNPKWDIAALELQYGVPLGSFGLGQFAQAKAIEMLADELRHSAVHSSQSNIPLDDFVSVGNDQRFDQIVPSKSNLFDIEDMCTSMTEESRRMMFSQLTESKLTNQWISQLHQTKRIHTREDLVSEFHLWKQWPLQSDSLVLQVPMHELDFESEDKSIRQKDLMSKAQTIIEESGCIFHPILFRGPHPISDDYLTESYDPELDDFARIASFVYRHSDLIASFEGLRKRREAVALLKSKSSKTGAGVREPSNREIRAAVLDHLSKEFSRLGPSGESMNAFVASIPITSGSRKKLKSKLKEMGDRQTTVQQPEGRENQKTDPDPLTNPSVSLYPSKAFRFGTPEIDQRLGLKPPPRLGSYKPPSNESWEIAEDLALDQIIHTYRFRSPASPNILPCSGHGNYYIILNGQNSINWSIVAKALNKSLVPFNRFRTASMCYKRWNYLCSQNMTKHLQSIQLRYHRSDQNIQMKQCLGQSLLSSPHYNMLPLHQPPPRTFISHGAPPTIYTSQPYPIGSCYTIQSKLLQNRNGVRQGSESSCPKYKKSISNEFSVPWACLDYAASKCGVFVLTKNDNNLFDVFLEKSGKLDMYTFRERSRSVRRVKRKRLLPQSFNAITSAIHHQSNNTEAIDCDASEVSCRTTTRRRSQRLLSSSITSQSGSQCSQSDTSSLDPWLLLDASLAQCFIDCDTSSDSDSNSTNQSDDSSGEQQINQLSSPLYIYSTSVKPPDRSILFPPVWCDSNLMASNSSDSFPANCNRISVIPFSNSEVSLFESMRQPITQQKDFLLPWALNGILSVANCFRLNSSIPPNELAYESLPRLICTSLWQTSNSYFKGPPQISWIGTSGISSSMAGRPDGLNVSLTPSIVSVDDLCRLEQRPSIMNDDYPNLPTSPDLMSSNADQSILLVQSRSPENQEPKNVLETFKAKLNFRTSYVSLDEVASEMSTCLPFNLEDLESTQQKSKCLTSFWKVELFSNVITSTAIDHLILLELRRLSLLLEHYGTTMRRRAEINSRAQPLFVHDQHLILHVNNIFGKFSPQGSALTSTTLIDLLKVNNICLTRDLLPPHSSQSDTLLGALLPESTNSQTSRFSDSRSVPSLIELHRRIISSLNMRKGLVKLQEVNEDHPLNEKESLTITDLANKFRLYLKFISSAGLIYCPVLHPKAIQTSAKLADYVLQSNSVSSMIRRADDLMNCLKSIVINLRHFPIPGLPAYSQKSKKIKYSTSEWNFLSTCPDLLYAIKSLTIPKKSPLPESEIMEVQARTHHFANSSLRELSSIRPPPAMWHGSEHSNMQVGVHTPRGASVFPLDTRLTSTVTPGQRQGVHQQQTALRAFLAHGRQIRPTFSPPTQQNFGSGTQSGRVPPGTSSPSVGPKGSAAGASAVQRLVVRPGSSTQRNQAQFRPPTSIQQPSSQEFSGQPGEGLSAWGQMGNVTQQPPIYLQPTIHQRFPPGVRPQQQLPQPGGQQGALAAATLARPMWRYRKQTQGPPMGTQPYAGNISGGQQQLSPQQIQHQQQQFLYTQQFVADRSAGTHVPSIATAGQFASQQIKTSGTNANTPIPTTTNVQSYDVNIQQQADTAGVYVDPQTKSAFRMQPQAATAHSGSISQQSLSTDDPSLRTPSSSMSVTPKGWTSQEARSTSINYLTPTTQHHSIHHQRPLMSHNPDGVLTGSMSISTQAEGVPGQPFRTDQVPDQWANAHRQQQRAATHHQLQQLQTQPPQAPSPLPQQQQTQQQQQQPQQLQSALQPLHQQQQQQQLPSNHRGWCAPPQNIAAGSNEELQRSVHQQGQQLRTPQMRQQFHMQQQQAFIRASLQSQQAHQQRAVMLAHQQYAQQMQRQGQLFANSQQALHGIPLGLIQPTPNTPTQTQHPTNKPAPSR